jgi:hypothetical protein
MMWMYLIGAYCIVGLVVTFAVKTNQRQKHASSLDKTPSLVATLLIGTICWPLVASFSLSDWRRRRRECRKEKTSSEKRGAWLELLQTAERLIKQSQTAFRASESHTIIHGLREVAMHENHWQESVIFRANGSALGSLKEFFQSGIHPKNKLEEFLSWQKTNDFVGTVVERPMDLHIRLLDSFFDSVQLANADEQQRILQSLSLLNSEFENHGISALKDSGAGGLIIKHTTSDSYVFVPHLNSSSVNLLCWCPDRRVIFDPCVDAAQAWLDHQDEYAERMNRRKEQ